MILYIDPSAVDMSKAVKDYILTRAGLLAIQRAKGHIPLQVSGGIPTLAIAREGEKLVEGLISGVLKEIEALRIEPVR